MNIPFRPLTAAVAATVGFIGMSQAFTDTNADLYEVKPRHQLERVVATVKAAPPVRTAWVPVSSKKLDGFVPVLPGSADAAQRLAKAELTVAVKR